MDVHVQKNSTITSIADYKSDEHDMIYCLVVYYKKMPAKTLVFHKIITQYTQTQLAKSKST